MVEICSCLSQHINPTYWDYSFPPFLGVCVCAAGDMVDIYLILSLSGIDSLDVRKNQFSGPLAGRRGWGEHICWSWLV
jgi:hypothetical protein